MNKTISFLLVFACVAVTGAMLAKQVDQQIAKRHAQIAEQTAQIEG